MIALPAEESDGQILAQKCAILGNSFDWNVNQLRQPLKVVAQAIVNTILLMTMESALADLPIEQF